MSPAPQKISGLLIIKNEPGVSTGLDWMRIMGLLADNHFSGLVQGRGAELVEIDSGTAANALAVLAIPVQQILSFRHRIAFHALSEDVVDS